MTQLLRWIKKTLDGDYLKTMWLYWRVSQYHQSSFWSFSLVEKNDKYLNPPMSQGLSPKSEEKKKRVFLKLGPPTLKPFGRLSTTPGFWLRCRKVWYQDGSMMAIPLLSRFATLLAAFLGLQLVQGNQVPVAYSICHKWVNYAYWRCF